MANDRMYMRCKACGEMTGLGKHYFDGWYNQPTAEGLEAWMGKHAPLWKHEDDYEDIVVYESHAVFEIVYESDTDYIEKWNAWQKNKTHISTSTIRQPGRS